MIKVLDHQISSEILFWGGVFDRMRLRFLILAHYYYFVTKMFRIPIILLFFTNFHA